MRVFKYVGKNIRRTPYQALAATMIMFLTFLTLQLFLLIAIGSQQILQHYESKPQVIAFFKDSTTQNDVEAIKRALGETGRVKELNYVTKEDALKIYREFNSSDPILLELVTSSMLPASLEVSTTSLADLSYIGDILSKEPVVQEVAFPKDLVQNVLAATALIRWVGGILVCFLIVFSVLIILMIIGFKIRIKRNEIEIMRLLGASTWFVRAPFLWEGMTYALIGATAAWISSYALIWYFT
ncbi:MAG TPA: permease-like cell division protein FtsX, partial [Patescibacteria group bacterium]|nr:permease-like cell division protein FtsX [Patescibacteria group bacterium]